jgi:hypothetical protein
LNVSHAFTHFISNAQPVCCTGNNFREYNRVT